MAVSALVPLEEYLRTVYEPDCEYLDGELVERVQLCPGRYRIPDICVVVSAEPDEKILTSSIPLD